MSRFSVVVFSLAKATLTISRKTELAVEFAYQLRDVSPKTFIHWFKSADLLSTPDASPSSTPTTEAQLDQWLKSTHNAESLLIVDPGESFEALLQPGEHGPLLNKLRLFAGTVILLTRSSQSGRQLAGPHGLCELRDLEAEASEILFRGRLGPLAQGSTAEISEVAQLMAYLPRAILQVARLITSAGMTVSQFLQLYKSGDIMKLRLFGKVDRYSNPDHRFSVVGKGVTDVRAFRNEFPEATRILYQIYFLGGKSVPRDIFSGMDQLDMIIIMFILQGHFLVVEDSTNGTYTIHPFVYLAIRSIQQGHRPEADEENIKEEREWHEEIITTFSDWYPNSHDEDRAWWRNCFAHVLAGCDLQVNCLRRAIAKIHRKESSYFTQRGRYNDALRMTLLAKNVLSVAPTADHLIISQEQITLLDLLGRYREVQAALQSYPDDDDQEIKLWKRRMQARLEQAEGADRYDAAVQIFLELKTSREKGDTSTSNLLQSMDDYGWILLLKGRYLDASTECRKSLAGRTSSFGISHIDTLSSFHHMSTILRMEGRYEEAVHYASEAIRGRENILGQDHPDTLQSKIVKALALLSTTVTLAEFDEVETLLVDSSNRLSTTLTEAHPIIIGCRSDRALIMLGRGKYDAAEQMNSVTLSVRQQGPWMEPTTHPDTLTSKHQLAEVLWLKEGCRAADSLSEEALVERTDILTHGTLTGDDFHPDQLSSLHLRAIILSGLGEHSQASQKIELALMGRIKLLGNNHPQVYESMTWKGEIMRWQLPTDPAKKSHCLDEIDALHRKALDGLTVIFGSQHQKTLQCMTNFALAKSERGAAGHSEAATIFHTVYRAYRHSVGELHPETLKAESRLAEAMGLVSPSYHHEAKMLWREACGGFSKAFGVDAYLTSAAYKGYEKFLRTFPDP